MTARAERIKAAHRGFQKSELASRSRIAALDSFGLRYQQVDDFNVIVEGKYQLNLAMSYWRSSDGTSHGYLVSALASKIRDSEKPVTGRDNVPAELEATELHQHVESVTGPISADAPLKLIPRSAVWP